MGWLRSLMAHSEPRQNSYGSLARACLARKEWPPGVQPQPRSLASLFSKFDRGIELEWLADRSQVQAVLSLVLKCPLGVIQAELGKTLERADHDRKRWRFQDVPIARPIDLCEEGLPPGVPELVAHPSRWGRVLWRADAGDGTNLVSAWLQARDLAQCVVARTWEDALTHFESPGPLFVEFQGPVSVDRLPRRDGICICAKIPSGNVDATWTRLQPVPVLEFLDPLLDWLHERLPRDGHFDRELARRWFDGPLKSGVVDCWLTALGLAGVLDELGVAKVRGRALHQLAMDFMEKRLVDASLAGSAEAHWLKKHGFDVLVGMAKRALTESPLPWEATRTEDEWMALVPLEFQRSVDVEWTTVSLKRAGTRLTAGELEKALADVPPGAFRVVRALLAARVLEPDPHGMFNLAPRWLGLAVRDRAEHRTLSDSPFEWGEALLRLHAKDRVRRLLFERVKQADPEFLDSVLELDDDAADPAYVMALETLTCAVGHAILSGTELDPEQLSSLAEIQSQFLFHTPDGLLLPSLVDTESLNFGEWLLALWTITEQLENAEDLKLGWLNPWDFGPADLAPHLAKALEAIAAYLDSEPANDWLFEALDLISRVAARTEEVLECDHPLTWPSRINGTCSFDAFQALNRTKHGLRAAARRTAEWPAVAERAWAAWMAAGFPETQLFDASGPDAELLWPHLPEEVLRTLLERTHPLALSLPYAGFASTSWLVVLSHCYPTGESRVPRLLGKGVAQAVPRSHLDRAVRGAVQHGDAEALRVFWLRDPEHLLALTLEGVAAGSTDDPNSIQAARLLLDTHCPAMTTSLVHGLREQFQREGISGSVVQIARGWLHGVVTKRPGAWREAYALLSEIERRLNRVDHARRGL